MREIENISVLIDGYTLLTPLIDRLIKARENGAKYIDISVDTSHRLENYHSISLSLTTESTPQEQAEKEIKELENRIKELKYYGIRR